MPLKDDLLRYKYLKLEIENLKQNIYELENLSVGVASYSETYSKTNARVSKTHLNVELIEILGERYRKRLLAILELKIKIDDEVQKLPIDERLVITEYYLNGLTWYEVSDKLFISLSWCYKLHNRALKMLSVK